MAKAARSDPMPHPSDLLAPSSLPAKRRYESDFNPFGNPFCQHELVTIASYIIILIVSFLTMGDRSSSMRASPIADSAIRAKLQGFCRMRTAGTWVQWQSRDVSEVAQIANVQAVLAVVLTAKASGTKARVFANNLDCTVEFIHDI